MKFRSVIIASVILSIWGIAIYELLLKFYIRFLEAI